MKSRSRSSKSSLTRSAFTLVVVLSLGTWGCAVFSGLDEFNLDDGKSAGTGGAGGTENVSSSTGNGSSTASSSSSGATSSSSSSASSSSAASSSSSASSSSGGVTSAVVIGEIYQSGGKQGAVYVDDYVVLTNTANIPANLNGWALQHYKTGNGWVTLPLTNAMLPAGGSYLIMLYNDGGGSGMALPNPDLTAPASSNWNLSTSNGEALAITSNTAVLNSCNSAAIVDLVGYNSNPPCKEGSAEAPTSTETNSVHRKAAETQDTNDNAADFALGPPSP